MQVYFMWGKLHVACLLVIQKHAAAWQLGKYDLEGIKIDKVGKLCWGSSLIG